MKEIKIKFSHESCQILIECGLLKHVGEFVSNLICRKCKVVLLVDENAHQLFGTMVNNSFLKAGFDVLFFILKSGEKIKNFKTAIKIFNFLAENNVKKTDLIISLGGGVVCDLAGFVSSCFLRGLRLVHIPTTLLAMVDASVGGKAAVNLKYGKNLVGCFKQPNLVLCDPNLTATLSKQEFSNGMAEVVKNAALFSSRFFENLVSFDPGMSYKNLSFIIHQCLEYKKKIVEADEFDTLNERIKLNFGHTVGHALEKYYGYSKIKHGHAVAIGMSFCVAQGEKLGLTKLGEFEKIKFILKKFGLPIKMPVNPKKIIKICLTDKKSFDGGLKMVLLNEIGLCFIKKFNVHEFKRFMLS